MRVTILPSAIILTKAHRAVVSMMPRGVLWPEYCLSCVSCFHYPNNFNINSLEMFYCIGIDKKGVLLHVYSQSAIPHAPHCRRVVKSSEYTFYFFELILCVQCSVYYIYHFPEEKQTCFA